MITLLCDYEKESIPSDLIKVISAASSGLDETSIQDNISVRSIKNIFGLEVVEDTPPL